MILPSGPTFRYKRLYSKSIDIYLAFKLFLFFIRVSMYKVLAHQYEVIMGNEYLLLFKQDEDASKTLSLN